MTQQNGTEKSPTSNLIIIVLIILATLLGIFLRFYKLNQIPPGFTFDEASHALDALDILQGHGGLISTRLKQTPTGYMVLLAGIFQAFGASVLAQRVLTACLGSLLIPLNFLAVRTLLHTALGHKALWAATFSTLLLSTSFWALVSSRIGYEYILPPLLALMAIFFFWSGYYENKENKLQTRWGRLAAAGFLTGIQFYFYEGSAPFTLVIPAAVALHWLLNRLPAKSRSASPPVHWPALLFFCIMVAIVSLPIFLALVSGPTPEATRTLRLSIFHSATNSKEILILLANSLLAHARPFLGLVGDMRWFSNLQGRPILNPILAISFVAGLFICLKRSRQLPYLLLLVYWGVMLIPAILTIAGSPFYFRMLGALPPTYSFIALAWTDLFYWVKAHLTRYNQIHHIRWPYITVWLALAPFLFVSFIYLPLETYRDYFIIWANHPKVAFYHDVPIINLVERMEQETNSEAIFILPRQAVGFRPNFTLDFLYHGPTPFHYIAVDQATVRQTLSTTLANYQTVYLISQLAGGREKAQADADAEALIPLLLDKYGEHINTEETEAYTILTYRLSAKQIDFTAHLKTEVPSSLRPLDLTVADQVKLRGIGQRQEANTLFIDLAWQGLSRIFIDYTVFVQLLEDETGITGVDIMPQPGFATLDYEEIMVTHYALPLTPEMRPGTYTMLVGLYYFAGDQLINVGAVRLTEPIILE